MKSSQFRGKLGKFDEKPVGGRIEARPPAPLCASKTKKKPKGNKKKTPQFLQFFFFFFFFFSSSCSSSSCSSSLLSRVLSAHAPTDSIERPTMEKCDPLCSFRCWFVLFVLVPCFVVLLFCCCCFVFVCFLFYRFHR